MKKIYLLFFLGVVFTASAQQDIAEISSIAEAEMKASSGLMNLVVNPNTTNYDVTYHKLQLTVNPSQYFISGIVTTTYTALSNMSTITFDLTNELTVTSVKRNLTNLTFTQNANNELVINLGAVQTAGTSATVVITYSGEPASGEQAFTAETHDGVPVIYTLSEPFGARDWWPCKQDLNDKINQVDIYITAPSQYVSVANGLEQSQVILGANKTTYFKHNYPIPAYLVAFAVTNYEVFTLNAGTAPNEFPIVNYVYPENLAAAQAGFAQTVPIMDLYEDLFETYPFANEKYGHAEFGAGGGMEHTTVSFMTGFNRELIAHELGHQWFGDKVTCGTWKDIWLNEGFATYLAALVRENFDGVPAFINWKSNIIGNITSAPGGSVYLTESESNDVNRIFSNRLTYNKGAMVLEMLRWKLGDTNFFQALRNYLADGNLAYKYAVTNDLQTHLETASGMDLDGFFDDWVYKQGFPTYTATAQNVANGQVKITLNQTQSHFSVAFFEMPVPIRVFGAGGQQMDLVLQNTTNGQVFFQNVPFAVTGFTIDPERHIITGTNTATLGTGDFEFAESIQIYPNPANDILNIEIPAAVALQKVTVYNNLGQKILETKLPAFSVSGLASGVHYMVIETGSGTVHKKFVKQ